MSKSIKNSWKPTHDEVARRAQHIYESEGRPEGRALQHWLLAEKELVAEHQAKAGTPPGSPVAKAAAPKAPASPAWQNQPYRPAVHTN